MKCPKCEREMRKGYLIDRECPVQWIPEDSKPSIWKTGVAEDAVVLSDDFSWRGYRADAFYCSACKFVIAPTEM